MRSKYIYLCIAIIFGNTCAMQDSPSNNSWEKLVTDIAQRRMEKERIFIGKLESLFEKKETKFNNEKWCLLTKICGNNIYLPLAKKVVRMLGSEGEDQDIKDRLLEYCVEYDYTCVAGILLNEGANSSALYRNTVSFWKKGTKTIGEKVIEEGRYGPQIKFQMFGTFLRYDKNRNFINQIKSIHRRLEDITRYYDEFDCTTFKEVYNALLFFDLFIIPNAPYNDFYSPYSEFFMHAHARRVTRLTQFLSSLDYFKRLPLDITKLIVEYRYPGQLSAEEKEFIKTIPTNDYLHPDRVKR